MQNTKLPKFTSLGNKDENVKEPLNLDLPPT